MLNRNYGNKTHKLENQIKCVKNVVFDTRQKFNKTTKQSCYRFFALINKSIQKANELET